MLRGARIKIWALGALIALAATACSGDDPPPAGDVSPAPSSVSSIPSEGPPAPVCDNASDPDLMDGSTMRTQGRLVGDLDGDSVDDVVTIANDPDGDPGCKTFIVAETDVGNLVAPTDPDGLAIGFDPYLQALVQADDRPGAEIVAQVLAGASTQFTAMFTVRDGTLVRVGADLVGPFGAISDLFPYGGSVGHLEASDCTEDGRILVSVATPVGGSGARYVVERRFLRFEGSDLVQDQVTRQVVSAFKVQELPEYKSSPFGSCPTS